MSNDWANNAIDNSAVEPEQEPDNDSNAEDLGPILNYIANLPPGIKQLVMPAAMFLLFTGLTYGAIVFTSKDHLAHFAGPSRIYTLARSCNSGDEFYKTSLIMPPHYLEDQFNGLEDWFFNANLGDEFIFSLPIKLQDGYTLVDVTYQKGVDANGTLFLDIIPPGTIFSKKPYSTNLGFLQFSDGSRIIVASNGSLRNSSQQPMDYESWMVSAVQYSSLIDIATPIPPELREIIEKSEGFIYTADLPLLKSNLPYYYLDCSNPFLVELQEENSKYVPLKPNILPLDVLNPTDPEFEQKAETIHQISATPFQSLGAATIQISRQEVDIENNTVMQSQQLSNTELILREDELIIGNYHESNSTSLQVITLSVDTENGPEKESVVVFTSMGSYPIVISKNEMIDSAAITYNSDLQQGVLRFSVEGQNVTNIEATYLTFNPGYYGSNIVSPVEQKSILTNFLGNFPTIDISSLPLEGSTNATRS